MKYAHLADLHLGSWRDQKMRDLSTKVFLTAIDNCLKENVDFIIFAGDLFNTSLPSLDTLKIVTKKLKELNNFNIPLYVIPGSHDFSPSGKTMIDVLENAGLLINVCKGSINQETKELCLKFTKDEKTGAKLTGIIGRKGQLDQKYYENLDRSNLESEEGYKIFLFHTTISELLPRDMAFIESQPASFFPKNFNYYAGGHIHNKASINLEEGGTATYPGALFPNNFAELEKYSIGGYYLVEFSNNEQKIRWEPLEVMEHIPLTLDCHHKSPEVITFEILNKLGQEVKNKLITIRLKGSLQNGKVSDINFKHIFETLYSQGAYFVMKNTSKLNSEEFEEISISQTNPELIEEETIKEHLQQITLFDKNTELHLTKSLLNSLNTTKKEGETITDFKRRVETEINGFLELE